MDFNDFKLDSANGIPIYVQLKQAIQYAVATGKYVPGSRLPTVRQMAVALKINPNTVSRVYSELERDGILATRQGRGTFVCEAPGLETEGRQQMLQELIQHFLVQAYDLGFSSHEALEAIQRMLAGNDERRGGEVNE
ncbi:MAG: GntR family transcriptional regulator [Clostridia bacterium]|nr:MAG: GntR family transcriptional regulator [Clostridia bacterium]